MGACIYCGKSAGWFSDRHDACAQKSLTPHLELRRIVSEWILATET